MPLAVHSCTKSIEYLYGNGENVFVFLFICNCNTRCRYAPVLPIVCLFDGMSAAAQYELQRRTAKLTMDCAIFKT